jgi:hypothetical protein
MAWCLVKAQGQLYLYDEVFSGYRPRQVSVWNRRFGDHLGHHHHHQQQQQQHHQIRSDQFRSDQIVSIDTCRG